MKASIQFEGFDDMRRRLHEYERRVKFAIRQVAVYWSAVFEAYAKQNAPWTDRTGNARQSLYTWIEDLSNDTVRLYLSHGVDYGVFLETKYAERFSIIMPTIRRHLPAIRQMLQDIFK